MSQPPVADVLVLLILHFHVNVLCDQPRALWLPGWLLAHSGGGSVYTACFTMPLPVPFVDQHLLEKSVLPVQYQEAYLTLFF